MILFVVNVYVINVNIICKVRERKLRLRWSSVLRILYFMLDKNEIIFIIKMESVFMRIDIVINCSSLRRNN